MSTVKERPILMSAPMVRALQAGVKTQTRRIVKPQPAAGVRWSPIVVAGHGGLGDGHGAPIRCPYGQPGDRLWVREAHAFTDAHEPDYMGSIEYRADNKCLAVDHGPVTVDVPHKCDPRPFDGPWRPSIHMPRWASRITLEITDERVQRLQEISREDAIAEGIEGQSQSGPWRNYLRGGYWFPEGHETAAIYSYRTLWESINGPGSWDVNPWVWALTFQRVA